MQLLLGGIAFMACVTAVWLALLRVRTTRRVAGQLRAVAARLERDQPQWSGTDDLAALLVRLGTAADASLGRLAEVEQRSAILGGAVEALPLGVVLAGPAGQVIFQNGSAETLVGTRPANALAANAVTELLAIAAAGEPQSRPLQLYGPARRTLSLTGIPLKGAAAVIIEDVSDRHRLDAVRRDFVANVSHELKTPVAALGLLAEAVAAEDDLATVRRLVGRMQDEAFRVDRIINDLLDLSRLESGPMVRHEPVPVHALVGEAVSHVRPAGDHRGIHIAVSEVPRSWKVIGEQHQLVSALANLLENAVKYSENDAIVNVGAFTDGATIEIAVEDHGVGIPSRELDRIFERFYRVDRGRSRDTGGTGLGLSIVRHVAANHGGEVKVTSVEGEGSVFTLVIPAESGPVGLLAEAG